LVADLQAINRAAFYEPTRLYPGLFRTFADLLEDSDAPNAAKTRQKVLDFANNYGCLGIAERLPTEIAQDVQADTHAESIWIWWQNMVALKDILALSDALKKGTTAALAPYATIYTCKKPEAGAEWERHQVGSPQEATDLTETLRRQRHEWHCSISAAHGTSAYYPHDAGETVASAMRKAAWQHVAREINYKIAVSPDEHPYARVELTFRPDESERPRFRLVANHLAGALWMQLARYVDGDKDYVQCIVCDKWLEISLDEIGFRTSRLYCSDACRSKAYRARQWQAHRLAHEGKTLAEIAHALETSTETVQGWLDKPPPGNGTRRRGRKPLHPTAQGKS
jgi:hypothetical protein